MSDQPSPLGRYDEPQGGSSASSADEALHERAVALALSRFGRLDIAINNAGIVHDLARLPDTPSDVARQVIEIDLSTLPPMINGPHSPDRAHTVGAGVGAEAASEGWPV